MPRAKPDPSGVAQLYIPGFSREKMMLNGREISLNQMMRGTNKKLKTHRMPVIDCSPAWVSKDC